MCFNGSSVGHWLRAACGHLKLLGQIFGHPQLHLKMLTTPSKEKRPSERYKKEKQPAFFCFTPALARFPVMFALVAEAAGMYYFSPIPQHFHSNSDGFVLRL